MDPSSSALPQLAISSAAIPRANSLNAESAPDSLGPTDLAGRAQFHHDRLAEDRPPRDYLESLAQIQVARNAAGLDVAFNVAASQLAGPPSGAVEPGRQHVQTRHIQALRTPAMAAALRFKATHQQSFVAAIGQLMRLQSRDDEIAIPAIFPREEDCRNYLVEWQRSQAWSCSHCGGTQRYWQVARPRFDCPCGRQYSATVGTLFAGSRLPLLTWFTATLHAIYRPQVTPRQLAAHVPTSRHQSIGLVLHEIKQALASDNADRLLAGVPQLALAHLPKVLRSRATHRDDETPNTERK